MTQTETLLLSASTKPCDWRRRWLGTKRYWLFQISGWSVFCSAQTVSAFFAPEGESIRIPLTILWAVISMGCTHLLRVVILLLGYVERPLARLWPVLIPLVLTGAAAINGPLAILWATWSDEVIPFREAIANYLFIGAHSSFMLTAWLACYFSWQFNKRYQQAALEKLELANAAKEAELQGLKAQLNPHFLFNSLNTVRAFIPRELTQPREAITLLSDLLRTSLAGTSHTLVPLGREMESIRNFLRLEQMRHAERLRVHFQLSPESLQVPVPSLMVQTLVENAVKHGIARLAQGGVVAITARVEASMLRLEITNPGQLKPDPASTGVGLANARARLRLLFGPVASLTLRETTEKGGTVVAELILPAESSVRP